MSEESRRELIARQHRALYGNESATFLPQGGYAGEGSQEQSGNVPTSAGGARGSSPRGMDAYGMSGQATQADSNTQGSAGDKMTSPSVGNNGFGGFDPAGQSVGNAPSPPAGEEGAHSRQMSKSTTAPISGHMGPIGSRPSAQQAPNQPLNKRTTSPLPGSLSFGFGADQSNERAASSNSNANNSKDQNNSGMGAWGTGSGVWGSNKIGATSVWG